jgi:hypothetical protein
MGGGQRLEAVERVAGGSKKGVYRLVMNDATTAITCAGGRGREPRGDQRDQRRTDAAGAIVQEGGEAVGECAAFAEPTAQELALEAAA